MEKHRKSVRKSSYRGIKSKRGGSQSKKGHEIDINWKDTLQITILANPGILFVDHIHFQYNSIMYGIQLLSIAAFFEGSYILGGLWFAIVLNFKHIYLYQVMICRSDYR